MNAARDVGYAPVSLGDAPQSVLGLKDWSMFESLAASSIAAVAMWPASVAICGRRLAFASTYITSTMVLALAAGALTRYLPVSAMGWPVHASLGAAAGVLAAQVTIDIWARRLPLRPSITMAAIVLISLPIGSATSRLWPAVVCATLMTAISATLMLTSGRRLGRGDVYLSPLLGAIIGIVNPWGLLTAWLATTVLAALFALAALFIGTAKRDTLIPYGPFMVAGTVIAVAAGVAAQ